MTLQTTWTNMRAPPSSSPSPSPSLAVSPPHPSDNKITAWLREAPLTLLLRQLNNDFAPAWRVCQRGDPASALPRQGFHCNNSFHHGWRATASGFVKLQSIFTEACLCERDRERMERVKVINVVGSMCVCVCVCIRKCRKEILHINILPLLEQNDQKAHLNSCLLPSRACTAVGLQACV